MSQTYNYHRPEANSFYPPPTTIPYLAIMSKLQHCFFFEPKEELYTGDETPLDLLLNGISLSTDIQTHINGFLDEEPEYPYLCGDDPEAYLVCHDDLNNEYVYPIDVDEKHCFENEFIDDFVLDERVFIDCIL